MTNGTAKRRHPKSKTATVQDLLGFLSAVHLSSYVDSPFQDRGGFMLVGPPGILKTTCVEFLDSSFPDAIVLSDVNTQGLTKIKDQFTGGHIRTLILPELGKIYQRHAATASNVEGTLQALVGEGFHSASFQDATISRLKARATVVAAMTGETREMHSSEWQSSGFARRFLWALCSLQDPGALDRAVIDGKLIDIAISDAPRVPIGGVIPNLTVREERAELATWCKYQPNPHTVQISLLIKCWAVLKWWARQQRRSEQLAWKNLHKISAALGRNGVELILE